MRNHEPNPFATRFTRPGSIPYQFPGDASTRLVLDRLRNAGWHGQIVGPHGSGKSTLLETLMPELAAARHVVRFALGARAARLPDHDRLDWQAHTQVVVDGYEQLGRWARWRLRRACRRCGAGLLVTCHHDAGLPTVWEARVTLEMAESLAARLLRGHTVLAADDVRSAFQHHGGNLRECFFELYDRFEEKRTS